MDSPRGPEASGVLARFSLELDRFHFTTLHAASRPRPKRGAVKRTAFCTAINRRFASIHPNPQIVAWMCSIPAAPVRANFSSSAFRSCASSKRPHGRPRMKRMYPPLSDFLFRPRVAERVLVFKLF